MQKYFLFLFLVITCISRCFGQETRIFTEFSQIQIVDDHNACRSTKLHKDIPASNMNLLKWSPILAKSAEEWASYLGNKKECVMYRKNEQVPYGVNLAWKRSSNYPQDRQEMEYNIIATSMAAWCDHEQIVIVPQLLRFAFQKKQISNANFSYGFNTFDHYTQIVHAETRSIGCAYTMCGNQRTTVCHYDPPGNIVGQSGVYEKGPPCSLCPEGTKCDSTGLLCWDGTWVPRRPSDFDTRDGVDENPRCMARFQI